VAPRERKFFFSDAPKREYPFLVSDETDVNKMRYACTLCKTAFSVTHGGRRDTLEGTCKEAQAVKAPSKKIDLGGGGAVAINIWTLNKYN
jgi:hypothetical protein